MYEIKYIHIYKDEDGKKKVSVCLACPGTKLGPLMGTWADHDVTVTIPFSKPEAIVPALREKLEELKKERHEEAMFLHELRDALKRA